VFTLGAKLETDNLQLESLNSVPVELITPHNGTMKTGERAGNKAKAPVI